MARPRPGLIHINEQGGSSPPISHGVAPRCTSALLPLISTAHRLPLFLKHVEAYTTKPNIVDLIKMTIFIAR